MKRVSSSIRISTVVSSMFVLAILIVAQFAHAATWNARAGGQDSTMGKQALAFLTNELWIHAGDSIKWTFPTTEPHTVSFLITQPAPQTRPTFQAGCPSTTPDGSPFTGTACVNSGELGGGQTYTVTFPNSGNFYLVCLVHVSMTGAVHVLDMTAPLPHDQAFYDHQGSITQSQLISDDSRLQERGIEAAQNNSDGEEDDDKANASGHRVTAGIAAIEGTGGGVGTAAVMRFLQDTIEIHVGDTVEWTNLGSTVAHTVTFGTEPANLMPPSGPVTTDSDGARHASIGSPSESVNSGFLVAAPQERVGLAQAPLGVTRFRVTFTTAGTFNYICGLHEELGMIGKVIVH